MDLQSVNMISREAHAHTFSSVSTREPSDNIGAGMENYIRTYIQVRGILNGEYRESADWKVVGFRVDTT